MSLKAYWAHSHVMHGRKHSTFLRPPRPSVARCLCCSFQTRAPLFVSQQLALVWKLVISCLMPVTSFSMVFPHSCSHPPTSRDIIRWSNGIMSVLLMTSHQAEVRAKPVACDAPIIIFQAHHQQGSSCPLSCCLATSYQDVSYQHTGSCLLSSSFIIPSVVKHPLTPPGKFTHIFFSL